MGVETAVAVAAITATAASVGSSAYAAHQANKQQGWLKKQQRQAEAVQREQNAQALATRKEQIDEQREGLYGHYQTKTTNTPQASGLTGKLENDILG